MLSIAAHGEFVWTATDPKRCKKRVEKLWLTAIFKNSAAGLRQLSIVHVGAGDVEKCIELLPSCRTWTSSLCGKHIRAHAIPRRTTFWQSPSRLLQARIVEQFDVRWS
jgi:hypothetical protein